MSIHLLETIAAIANQIHREEDREVLLAHARMVFDGCIDKLEVECDRKDIEERYEAAVKALQ